MIEREKLQIKKSSYSSFYMNSQTNPICLSYLVNFSLARGNISWNAAASAPSTFSLGGDLNQFPL